DHIRGRGLVSAEPTVDEPDLSAELLVEDVRAAVTRRLRPVVLNLLAQLADLGLGLEGVREEPGDVADRGQGLACALLNRREDLDNGALQRVQRARCRLAEVGRQQY